LNVSSSINADLANMRVAVEYSSAQLASTEFLKQEKSIAISAMQPS